MLMIRVLGVGAIPRGKGIAPKRDPFPCDLETLKIILSHGALIPQMKNPKTGNFITITSENLMKLWKAFGNEKPVVRKSTVMKKDLPAPKQVAMTDAEIKELAQETANEFLDKKEAEQKQDKNNQPNNNNNKKPWDNKKPEEKKIETKTEPTDTPADDGKLTVIPSSDKK